MTRPEEVRCLVLVEHEGSYHAETLGGGPYELPEGMDGRHVAAMLALLCRGNAVPLLRCLPPALLPLVESNGP